MSMNTYDKRRSVDDILASGGSEINSLWNATPAAGDDFDPIPAGTYQAVITDGRVQKSTKGTSSFRIEFQIVDGAYANRRVWHHCWLTQNAMAMTKRDLAKLGILEPEQLREAAPAGLICEVRVAMNTQNDGPARNEVKGFKVVANASLSVNLDADEPDRVDDEDDDDKPPY